VGAKARIFMGLFCPLLKMKGRNGLGREAKKGRVREILRWSLATGRFRHVSGDVAGWINLWGWKHPKRESHLC